MIWYSPELDEIDDFYDYGVMLKDRYGQYARMWSFKHMKAINWYYIGDYES